MNATRRGGRSLKRRSWREVAPLLVLALGLLWAAPALAVATGQPPAQARPADPQGGFVPVKDLPAQEHLAAAPLLISAYAFVWVALLVYVWSVWRRLTKVEREIQALSRRLDTRQGERR